MNYKITKASCFALSILKTCSIASVHSIYRNTINLCFKFQGKNIVLSLQTSDTVLSPVSLITNLSEKQFRELPISKGDAVIIKEHYIFINSSVPEAIFFSAEDISTFDLKLKSELPKSEISDLIYKLHDAIKTSELNGFDSLFADRQAPSPVLDNAKAIINTSSFALSQYNWEKAASALSSLIGLGIGLTPSGDDFLCGVLAGIHFLNASSHPFSSILREKISLHVDDTNLISSTFLLCAINGQFSLPITKLPKMKSSSSIMSVFKKIGHSSGIDSLCGIYYICSKFPV